MEKLYKMRIYSIQRTTEYDKSGRPAIFLSYFGKESLVWKGTTNSKVNSKEIPLIIELNNKKTYFYNKGIIKIQTSDIKNYWKNNGKEKPIKLTNQNQKDLIAKWIELTKQTNPYELIKKLETEIKTITEQLVSYQQELINNKIEKDLLLASANKIINELQNKLEQLQQELLSIHK